MAEDFFGRRGRAKALVDELYLREPVQPEVWGIIGPWESGKTTAPASIHKPALPTTQKAATMYPD